MWFAPSPLWNEIMRGGSINGTEEFSGIVCPTCFAVLAEEAGIAFHWRLDALDIRVGLELVTPSGRRWNPVAGIWETSPASDQQHHERSGDDR